MYKDTLLFIGLDTHKESTEVAYVLEDRTSSCQHYGKIPTTKQALTKLARQFVSKYPDAILHFVYEAGPLWLLGLSFTEQSGTLLLCSCPVIDCQETSRSDQNG